MKLLETSFDERASDSLSLPLRYNRDGTKTEPAVAPTIDGDRRKCDVADNAIVLCGDKRSGQTSRRAKGLHDPGFVATAMLSFANAAVMTAEIASSSAGTSALIVILHGCRFIRLSATGWKAGHQPAS